MIGLAELRSDRWPGAFRTDQEVVDLRGQPVTDADLARLASIPLHGLKLSNMRISQRLLDSLRLEEMYWLALEHCELESPTLARFNQTNFQILDLSHSRNCRPGGIPECFRWYTKLGRCMTLGLDGCPSGSTKWRNVADVIAQATCVSLQGTDLMDEDFAALVDASQYSLIALYVSETGISDHAFDSVSPGRDIVMLHLHATAVTDRAADCIARSFPSLIELDVGATGFTTTGIRRLLDAIPSLQNLGCQSVLTEEQCAVMKQRYPHVRFFASSSLRQRWE